MNFYQKFLFVLVSVLFVSTGTVQLAKADTATPTPVSINFDVEGATSTIFSQASLSVPACTTPNNATSTVNGFCAFGSAGLPVDASWSSSGAFVTGINGVAGDSSNFWLWFLNGDAAQVGIDSYMLQPNDTVLWALGREPLKISLTTTTPKVNATSTVTVLGFDPIKFDFEPLPNATITGTSLITDSNGKAAIVPTSTAPFNISVTATGFISSRQFTITPQPERITLTIRDGTTTPFSGSVNLPDISTPDLQVAPTNSTSTVAVPARSVLGVLENLQASSTAFNITNLAYFSSFNSFIINCLAVPSTNPNPNCNNWTDAVNGVYPGVGVDHQLLKDGDVVYLFFGSPHQTILSKSSVSTGEAFTATAQQYDLTSGTYKPLTGVTLGVGTPNPFPTPFTELATSTVDSNGRATFTLNTAGSFKVGIKNDFYFPTTSLTVTNPGGAGGGVVHSTLDISAALNFIVKNQKSDGSFDSPFSTDWTAVAFAGADPGAAKAKLRTYLLTTTPQLSSVTDYERHAMALMALNINPYSDTSINYIKHITDSFDGTQIGTSDDNDDIFALIVLEHAGFSSADDIIKKEAAYVLSKQQPNGSWDNSPDMTGAAILALGGLFDIPGVNADLGKSVGYLFSTQKPDGGWGNPDSTSWVQTAINGIIEAHTPGFQTESAWTSSRGFYPTDALASAQQQIDGGVSSANRVWSTSYAVVAASGKSWVTLLQSFAKPAAPSGGGAGASTNIAGGSNSAVKAATTTATSTLPVLPINQASSTPPTSTPPILPIFNPVATTSTTTLAVLPSKPKIHKSVAHIISHPSGPAVLGASTQQPINPQPPQPQAQDQHPPGFWHSVWNSIANFFSNLF